MSPLGTVSSPSVSITTPYPAQGLSYIISVDLFIYILIYSDCPSVVTVLYTDLLEWIQNEVMSEWL